jgi:hypothetical protein
VLPVKPGHHSLSAVSQLRACAKFLGPRVGPCVFNRYDSWLVLAHLVLLKAAINRLLLAVASGCIVCMPEPRGCFIAIFFDFKRGMSPIMADSEAVFLADLDYFFNEGVNFLGFDVVTDFVVPAFHVVFPSALWLQTNQSAHQVRRVSIKASYRDFSAQGG